MNREAGQPPAVTEEYPDPRPSVVIDEQGSAHLLGFRCEVCGLAVGLRGPMCPACRGRLVSESFGPEGIVWSSTILRVALPGREPPLSLLYVDLTDGPRVLGHFRNEDPHRVDVGKRVRLVGMTSGGDLAFVES